MAFSNLVMFAIIVATATTLHDRGQTELTSAADAAKGLEPVVGPWWTTMFALGLVGTGLLAIPVLAGSAAAGIAGLMGKTFGFSRSPRHAPVFYGLVALGTVVGTLPTLTAGQPGAAARRHGLRRRRHRRALPRSRHADLPRPEDHG